MLETKLITNDSTDFCINPQHLKVEIKPIIDKGVSQNIKTALVKVFPSGEIKPHTHETLEVFHIIEGSGEVLVNGSYQPFSKGDTIYAPAGILHGLKNNSGEEVILIANFPNCKS